MPGWLVDPMPFDVLVVNSSLSLVLEDYLNSSQCLSMLQLAVVIIAAHVIVLLYVSVSCAFKYMPLICSLLSCGEP